MEHRLCEDFCSTDLSWLCTLYMHSALFALWLFNWFRF